MKDNYFTWIFDLPNKNAYNSKSLMIYDAGWSSLVARRAHNPEVVGSNPAPATNSLGFDLR